MRQDRIKFIAIDGQANTQAIRRQEISESPMVRFHHTFYIKVSIPKFINGNFFDIITTKHLMDFFQHSIVDFDVEVPDMLLG